MLHVNFIIIISTFIYLNYQSPASQTVAGSPSYIYAAMHASPELMYAQPPPHAYQPAELTDTAAAVMEAGQAAFEVIPNPFAV